MGTPRIGHPDALAALAARHRMADPVARALGPTFTPDPLPRALARLAEPQQPPVNRDRLAALAVALAANLAPLPLALTTVAIRVRRRLRPGPGQPQDEALVAALDLLRARVFDLWLNVVRLEEEARAAPARGHRGRDDARS